MIAQIYVDDIVFGSNNKKQVDLFINQMKSEFQMSIVGDMNYFRGLQAKQLKDKFFYLKANMYEIWSSRNLFLTKLATGELLLQQQRR